MPYGSNRLPSVSGAPPTNRPFRLGMCTYNQPDFPKVAALGVPYIRTDNPNSTKVDQIRAAGCDVIAIARYALGDITNSGQVDAWCAGKLALWSGMATPPTVFEICNEPWNASFSDFTTNYARYLEIVRSFCAQAWALWPRARMLVCGDTGPVTAWLPGILAADTTGILRDPRVSPTAHCYCEDRAPTSTSGGNQYMFARYRATYDAFRAIGHPNPMVWVTEFGWESSDTAGVTPVGLAVTEAVQATYTTTAMDMMRTSGVVETACLFGMMQTTSIAYNVVRPTNANKPAADAVASYAYGKL